MIGSKTYQFFYVVCSCCRAGESTFLLIYFDGTRAFVTKFTHACILYASEGQKLLLRYLSSTRSPHYRNRSCIVSSSFSPSYLVFFQIRCSTTWTRARRSAWRVFQHVRERILCFIYLLYHQPPQRKSSGSLLYTPSLFFNRKSRTRNQKC
jgi:hypothetical protein